MCLLQGSRAARCKAQGRCWGFTQLKRSGRLVLTGEENEESTAGPAFPSLHDPNPAVVSSPPDEANHKDLTTLERTKSRMSFRHFPMEQIEIEVCS